MINADCKDGKMIIHISGDLDHNIAKSAMEKIENLIDLNMPTECAINLSNLNFMDSSGIAIMLLTKKYMDSRGGKAFIVNPKSQPKKVLTAASTGKYIKIFTL